MIDACNDLDIICNTDKTELISKKQHYIEQSIKGRGQCARELPEKHLAFTKAEVEGIVSEVLMRYGII